MWLLNFPHISKKTAGYLVTAWCTTVSLCYSYPAEIGE